MCSPEASKRKWGNTAQKHATHNQTQSNIISPACVRKRKVNALFILIAAVVSIKKNSKNKNIEI